MRSGRSGAGSCVSAERGPSHRGRVSDVTPPLPSCALTVPASPASAAHELCPVAQRAPWTPQSSSGGAGLSVLVSVTHWGQEHCLVVLGALGGTGRGGHSNKPPIPTPLFNPKRERRAKENTTEARTKGVFKSFSRRVG